MYAADKCKVKNGSWQMASLTGLMVRMPDMADFPPAAIEKGLQFVPIVL